MIIFATENPTFEPVSDESWGSTIDASVFFNMKTSAAQTIQTVFTDLLQDRIKEGKPSSESPRWLIKAQTSSGRLIAV